MLNNYQHICSVWFSTALLFSKERFPVDFLIPACWGHPLDHETFPLWDWEILARYSWAHLSALPGLQNQYWTWRKHLQMLCEHGLLRCICPLHNCNGSLVCIDDNKSCPLPLIVFIIFVGRISRWSQQVEGLHLRVESIFYNKVSHRNYFPF